MGLLAIALIAFATTAGARQEPPKSEPAKAEPPKVEAAKNPSMEALKGLVGSWYRIKTENGQQSYELVSVYKLTGGGKVVHETIFPGKPFEMITVYHLDGNDVVATHYCAAGNQPRFKLDPSSTATKMVFNFNGGSNIDPAKDMHMHEGTVTIIDADHIEGVWQGWENGQPAEKHKATLKLTRFKS